MTDELTTELVEFTKTNKIRTSGPLSVAIVVTQFARSDGLPLDPDTLLTERGGQVRGLNKSAVQSVLERHGIFRVLSQEAGRTSRGSIGNMRAYVQLLNNLHSRRLDDLDVIEAYWVSKVQDYFAKRPFKINLDASRSLRTMVRDLIEQAKDRTNENPGTYYQGAVLQHLVGAKLDIVLGPDKVNHNSFSTADAPTGRPGDFIVEDVAIHVTATPGDAVIAKCQQNIDDGLRPLLVTTSRGVDAGEVLAENQGLANRIDIFDIEQFLAFNVYERGKFLAEGRRSIVSTLVTRYNEIISLVETDPSLRIEWST